MSTVAIDRDYFLATVQIVLERMKDFPRLLRKQQEDAIFAAIGKQDVFAILPTGFGKSLIYQALPLIYQEIHHTSTPPVVLVVSPLARLMKEQVDRLNCQGIASMWIGQPKHEMKHKTETCLLVFGSPEGILSGSWRENIENDDFQQRLIGVVIDEVHCITEW